MLGDWKQYMSKIAIIGVGSYALGDQYGPGVVIRSIVQYLKLNNIFDPSLVLVYQTEKKLALVQKEVQKILTEAQFHLPIEYIQFENFVKESTNEISAAFICVPDEHHLFYLNFFMDRSVPVWIVKPLTSSYKESKEIFEKSSLTKSLVWVDYHKRFDPSNRLLKKRIADRKFGLCSHIHVNYFQPRDLPLETFSWAEGVNVASYIGCHYIDLMNYLVPSAKPLLLSAVPVKGPVFSSRKIYDAILITIKYDVDGREVIFTMNVGWSNPLGAPTKSIQNIDLLFEGGRFVVDQAHRGFEEWSDQSISYVNPDFFQNTFMPGLNISAYDGYGYTSISLFLDSIFKGGADFSISANPSLPLVQNVYQVELITDAIKESLDNQSKWVEL